jgi:methyl-accepting chemotaxis protein
MNGNQRGKEYIDPQVQGALWKRMVAHWLVFALVAALLATGLEWMSDPFRSFEQLASDMWWSYSPLLLAILILVPAFVFDAIRMSHRFAGPVYRVRQVIRNLAEGHQTGRVEFRDNDFWKDMAGDLNRVIERVRQPLPESAHFGGPTGERSTLAGPAS